MADAELDDVDLANISELQRDARTHSNAGIAERIGVSASTVGDRISRLEDVDVVMAYRP